MTLAPTSAASRQRHGMQASLPASTPAGKYDGLAVDAKSGFDNLKLDTRDFAPAAWLK